EQWLLAQLVAALPGHLTATVQAQLRSYNLAQREIDGRAINLYRSPVLLPQVPLLPMSVAEAPLIRLTASSDTDEPSMRSLAECSAWRSAVPLRGSRTPALALSKSPKHGAQTSRCVRL